MLIYQSVPHKIGFLGSCWCHFHSMASVWVLGLTFLGTVPNSLFLSLLFCIQYSAAFMHNKSEDQIFFFFNFLTRNHKLCSQEVYAMTQQILHTFAFMSCETVFLPSPADQEASDCNYSLEIFLNLIFFSYSAKI